MFRQKDRTETLRSNRAVSPYDGSGRPLAGEDSRGLWADRRPNLLTRMARVAQEAVREARDAADVPLPHLYRGRDFAKKRRAA